MNTLAVTIAIVLYFPLANLYSYLFLKKRILRRQKWDLNICCGNTDGGGQNVDIVTREVPNFRLINDIYNLPFNDQQFESVLCSHTIEHVENPQAFLDELKRVGKQITVVVPPLWDLGAHINFTAHRWIFLSCKKEHTQLPKHIRVPFARIYQKYFGQVI